MQFNKFSSSRFFDLCFIAYFTLNKVYDLAADIYCVSKWFIGLLWVPPFVNNEFKTFYWQKVISNLSSSFFFVNYNKMKYWFIIKYLAEYQPMLKNRNKLLSSSKTLFISVLLFSGERINLTSVYFWQFKISTKTKNIVFIFPIFNANTVFCFVLHLQLNIVHVSD